MMELQSNDPKNTNIDYLSNPPSEDSSIEPNIPTLLLVEDNRIALKVVESMVSQTEYQFISCIDGESALHLCQSTNLDMIITDIGLPGISGIELTQKIRLWESQTAREPIPIIGLTAHAADQVKQDCLLSGMNQIYSKPLELKDLKAIQYQFCKYTN